jgi:Rieske Fe-S protein
VKLNRRQFLLLTAGLVAGSRTAQGDPAAVTAPTRTVNAGPAGRFAADGVYSDFRDQGFFIIRRGGKQFVLSEPDRSFYCKCHGSTFDPAGHVTEGPARRDLPVLPSYTDEQGKLQVKVSTG